LRALLLAVALAGAASGGESVLDAALAVAKRDHPRLDEARVRAEIDRLAARYRALAGESPVSRAAAFAKLLFEEEKFAAVAELDRAEHLHLDSVLKGRKGYCLSLSVVALAVAERAGEPLYGVALPNHFLVRYDNGTFVRNLELTRKGAVLDDKSVRGDFGAGSVYGRNLEPAEVKACLLHNRGYVALLAKRERLARADFEAAIKLAPGFGEAHRNLGVALGERGQWEAAKSAFMQAIRLHAGDADALVNLAICRRRLGERDAARQDLEMALSLDPGKKRAEALLVAWREQDAAERAETAEALGKPPPGLEPGLRARYYAGLGFDKLVVERVDRALDFDWQNDAPAKGVPRDRFSVRWEGYLKAPRTATYTLFLIANDGVRLRIGDKLVLDNWKNMGFRNWYGTKDIELEAGWHKLRVEHFDVMGGARVLLRIGVEGRKLPLDPHTHLFHNVK
jgi:regulator of sirC expression with transglutaminase-like and TPR domain